MGKLFGTDGIRGVANTYPMTPEMAMKIGKAAALYFGKNRSNTRIVVGKDTRISGDMLEHAIVAGICSAGADAYLTGVIPTPGVAYLARMYEAAAGIVISASHNPFYDNGFKFFKGNGYKLSDESETEIEELFLDNKTPFALVQDIGRSYKADDAVKKYAQFLKSELTADLKGLKLVIDCANGATYKIAPEVFIHKGATVESLFISPNGKNINEDCGSQHTRHLQKAVVEKKADMGFAFDGDGDRVIAVDNTGKVISGDQVLAICAKVLKKQGKLKNDTVVSTVMSNIGFKIALKDMGIKHIAADVGDRYVMKEMLDSGAIIGGEDSGHTIFLDHHTTGDGILTALRLIEAVVTESAPLSQLADVMRTYPQVLLNVEVTQKPDIESIPAIQEEIRRVEAQLGEMGRVLVRYSGTQPLCRVMVEASTQKETESCCKQIAEVIKSHLTPLPPSLKGKGGRR